MKYRTRCRPALALSLVGLLACSDDSPGTDGDAGATDAKASDTTEVNNASPDATADASVDGSASDTAPLDAAPLDVALPDAESGPSLAALTTSAGMLEPPFSPGQTSYKLVLSYYSKKITVTATPSAGATVTGDGDVEPPEGASQVVVTVTAADGGTTRDYTIDVDRYAPLKGVLHSDQTFTAAGSPYYVAGDLTINTGVSVTFEAGCELRMAGKDAMASGADTDHVELISKGTLTIAGTEAEPVVLRPVVMGLKGAWYGVVLKTGSQSSAAQSTISHATIRFATNGISVYHDDAQLSHCRIESSASRGIWLHGDRATIERCEIWGGVHGIESTLSSHEHKITRSVIRDNATTGIRINRQDLNGAKMTLIKQNTFWNNGDHGIHINNSKSTAGVTISSSAFVTHGRAVAAEKAAGIVLRNCLVHDSQLPTMNVSVLQLVKSNPLFVNPPDDFRLQANSPCRGAGEGGIDIGAYQYGE